MGNLPHSWIKPGNVTEIVAQYFCKGTEHLLNVHTGLVNVPEALIGDLHYLHS